MAQHYSDKTRAADPHALPDVETFYVTESESRANACVLAERMAEGRLRDGDRAWQRGWYWQACFPGCLPDSEPFGPFETEAEALADVGWALLD